MIIILVSNLPPTFAGPHFSDTRLGTLVLLTLSPMDFLEPRYARGRPLELFEETISFFFELLVRFDLTTLGVIGAGDSGNVWRGHCWAGIFRFCAFFSKLVTGCLRTGLSWSSSSSSAKAEEAALFSRAAGHGWFTDALHGVLLVQHLEQLIGQLPRVLRTVLIQWLITLVFENSSRSLQEALYTMS